MIPDLEIRKLTKELHESDQPVWRRLRVLLAEKGIEWRRSVVAYFAEEEPYYDFGVIVSDRREVFQFALDYLNRDVMEGRFAEWNDITGKIPRTPYRNQVELALKLLEKLGEEE